MAILDKIPSKCSNVLEHILNMILKHWDVYRHHMRQDNNIIAVVYILSGIKNPTIIPFILSVRTMA